MVRNHHLFSSVRPAPTRTLARDNNGASLIEFALVLPVLLLFLLGTIEYCLVFYIRGSIESVTHDTARKAITGSSYGGSGTREEELDSMLQESLANIHGTNGTFNVTTEVYANLSNLGTPLLGASKYGGSNHIVRYVVEYEHNFITPLAHFLAEDQGDKLVLTSTVFVKNEDF